MKYLNSTLCNWGGGGDSACAEGHEGHASQVRSAGGRLGLVHTLDLFPPLLKWHTVLRPSYPLWEVVRKGWGQGVTWGWDGRDQECATHLECPTSFTYPICSNQVPLCMRCRYLCIRLLWLPCLSYTNSSVMSRTRLTVWNMRNVII